MIKAPQMTSDAPATSVSRDAINPPVHDSTVQSMAFCFFSSDMIFFSRSSVRDIGVASLMLGDCGLLFAEGFDPMDDGRVGVVDEDFEGMGC